MPSRHPLPRPTRLVALGALLGIGLTALSGCYGGRYDESINFHVRSDMVVNPNETWVQQPTGFYHPGILPLDVVKRPEKELPADIVNLKKEIGKKVFDPADLPAGAAAEYAKNLLEMFGTPAHPKVSGFEPAALKLSGDESLTPDQIIKVLGLDEAKLAEGSRLYRQQCLHCHGLEGNGRGPTGYWVNPPPRDYRQGIFKFTSSTQDQNARKPRRDDILHVLTHGIEGTSMPSFGLMSREKELEPLVSYVIFLSFRGEAEFTTMLDHLKEKKVLPILRSELQTPTVRQAMEDNMALIAARWVQAQQPDTAIQPAPYPYADDEKTFLDSATRGGRLFTGPGGCISCHQNYGREANLVYDAWGTIIRGRNLYDGIYRGGGRPIDLYFRIHGGINGAGMTAYKDINTTIDPKEVHLTAEQRDQMKVDYLWDLVNFLKAMPFPEYRAELKKRGIQIAD